jgi:hemerythrin-like domain-containing protein
MLEEFKKEHSAIVNILNNVKKLGIRSKKGQDELLSAKNSILKHMKNEDKKFYPVLRKAAKHNQRLKEILDEFDKDMARISSYTFGFFDGHSSATRSKFAMELEKFVEILKRRILREEAILFEEYKKL